MKSSDHSAARFAYYRFPIYPPRNIKIFNLSNSIFLCSKCIFPFYLHFKGGKGIASLAGFILATDQKCFIFLLIVGCLAAVVVNYGCAISFSAAILFPIICLVRLRSMATFAILTVCSVAIVYKHMDNIQKIRAHKEMPIRHFLGNYIFGRG